jgi:outer membrane receptor protein involved in Fe transport
MQQRTHKRRAGARPRVAVVVLLSCGSVHHGQAADAAAPAPAPSASAPAASIPAVSASAVPELRVDAVTITGTRSLRAARNVPASISVIGSRQLELRPSRSNGDELAVVPGLLLARENDGMDNGVTIRGVPGRHGNDNFLVLVDGLPQMNMNSEAALDVLPPGVVRRVEVVKGPMSALYGRGGVSGAVHYITLDPVRPDRNEVGIEAGSFGWLRPHATVGTAGDRVGIAVSAAGVRSDGFVRDTERKAESAFAKAVWRIADGSTLTGSLSHYRNRQQLSGTVPLDAAAELMEVPRRGRTQIPGARGERESDVAQLTWEQGLGIDWDLKFSAGHAQRRSADVVGALQGADDGVIAWMGVDAQDRNRVSVLDAQLSGSLAGHRIVGGVTAERMRGRGSAVLFGEPPGGESEVFFSQLIDATTGALLNPGTFARASALDFHSRSRVDSAYLQDEMELTERVVLTVGARLDRFSRTVDYTETLFAPQVSIEGRGRHTSPKAAVTFKLDPATTLYASFGEGFNPTFGPPVAFVARPSDLKPEIARGWELGAKGEFGRIGTYAVSVYRLDRRNLAEWILPVGSGEPAFANAGRQRSRGLELETEWRLDALANGLQAYANYAYTRAHWQQKEIVDPDTGDAFDFSGRHVPGVPLHTLALGARLPLGEWLLYGGVEASGDYWVDYANTVRKGGYDTWHAGLRWRGPSGLQVQLLVRNLFDRRVLHYQSDHFGPTEATRGEPRVMSLGVSYRF